MREIVSGAKTQLGAQVVPLQRIAPSYESEADLGAALIRGDAAAAHLAWKRYAPMVRRIIKRTLGPGYDVDDYAQDAFLRFFTMVPSLEEPKAFRSFLITVTTNVVRDALKYRWVRRIMQPLGPAVSEKAARAYDPIERDALGRFYKILDRLSADDRTAYVLRYIEEMDLGEVADALGCSLSTVKRRLFAIHKRVFKMVERDPALVEYLTAHHGRSPDAS
jgi:RNA polymerase sigma-70 factor (ECF subfamily)